MKEKPMRHLMYGVLAGLILAVPVQAQPANNSTAPLQGQAAKDSKSPGDQAGGQAKPPQGNGGGNSALQAAKDDSMANYDVNGSNASDAMGAAP